MSEYYHAHRTRGLYNPTSDAPFRLSRSKIDLFLECPRCFYYDRRLGVARPPGYPFSLNSAVDALLKKEFDAHRAEGTTHPLMEQYGIDALPFAHSKMEEWRDSLRRGITYHDKNTNFVITGGVDDVWVNPADELIIVDYKATSKNGEVSLNAPWQIGYKRQMEVYQWLFRKNNFIVSDTGYFVYCNGQTDREAFDGKLEFDVVLLPYTGNDSWVEKTIMEAHACLNGDKIPKAGTECDYCSYTDAINNK
jgi:hypothetical protein